MTENRSQSVSLCVFSRELPPWALPSSVVVFRLRSPQSFARFRSFADKKMYGGKSLSNRHRGRDWRFAFFRHLSGKKIPWKKTRRVRPFKRHGESLGRSLATLRARIK